MNRLLGFCLALIAFPAYSATLTYQSSATTADTTASATYTSGAFTPTAGDAIVVFCGVSGTATNPASITSSVGGDTYTQVYYGSTPPSVSSFYWFVSDQGATASSQTVTCDVTGDNGSGGIVVVYTVDITNYGEDAIRNFSTTPQIAVDTSSTPEVGVATFPASVLTGNPTLGCLFAGSNPPGATAPTGWTEGPDTGYDTPSIGAECFSRDSGFTGTDVTMGSSEDDFRMVVIELSASSTPQFTAGPTAGTSTSTTIPFTFTTDTTGTVYGVACPDGQAAPSVAQVLAGDCTGDVTAESALSEAVTAGVGDGETFTGLTASTTYDTHFAIDAAADSAAVSSVPDQTTAASGAPTFTAAPSCSATTNGVSCTYTASATSTAYGVGVSPGDGTPTCTQIKAGQNDAGSAAIATGSDSNTGTSDTISVTGSNAPPRLDYHFCLNNGGGDSSVDSSQVNEDRSARSGFALVVVASQSATGICDLDSYFDPDCADGDVFEYEDDTNENANCNVSIETDGDVILTPVGAGDCDGKQTFNISYEDVSSATTGLFTAPTTGNFTTDDLICVNNSAPEAEDPFGLPIMWEEDTAIEALDLTAYITDPDGDTLTFTLTTGTWPTGVSQSGTGNKDVTGTPTTENESGVDLVIRGTDECGDYAEYSFYDGTAKDLYVVNTWTVPNLDSMDASEAEEAIVAAAPWRIGNVGLTIAGYTCGTGQPFLSSADQDPNASEEAEPFENIDITIVGAIIPDLTGLTQAQAIALIEAICP